MIGLANLVQWYSDPIYITLGLKTRSLDPVFLFTTKDFFEA